MKFEYTLAELSTAITALEQVYGKVSVLDPYLGTVLDPAPCTTPWASCPSWPKIWTSCSASPSPGPAI